MLDNQFENFIIDMRPSDSFLNLKGIGEVAQKIVKIKKNDIYPLVYLLVKKACIDIIKCYNKS